MEEAQTIAEIRGEIGEDAAQDLLSKCKSNLVALLRMHGEQKLKMETLTQLPNDLGSEVSLLWNNRRIRLASLRALLSPPHPAACYAAHTPPQHEVLRHTATHQSTPQISPSGVKSQFEKSYAGRVEQGEGLGAQGSAELQKLEAIINPSSESPHNDEDDVVMTQETIINFKCPIMQVTLSARFRVKVKPYAAAPSQGASPCRHVRTGEHDGHG